MRLITLFFFVLMPFFASFQVSAAFSLADVYIPAEVKTVHSFVSADSVNFKVDTLVKGFASNDPYMPKTVSVPKAGFFTFARSGLGSVLKTNAWWIAFSLASGYILTDDGPVIQGNYIKASDYPNLTTGSCNSGYGGTSSSFGACEAYIQTIEGFREFVSPGWYQCYGDTYYQGFCGSSTPLRYYRQFNRNGSTGYAGSIEFPPGTIISPSTTPVSDAQLENDFLTVCAANPLDCANAFKDAEGVPYPELFPNTTYLPNVNPADEPLLQCYFNGQLQTTNSAAACYVTQPTYDRIKALADALVAGKTLQGEADAANQSLKNPLTQAQLEESHKKWEEAQKKAEADADAAAKAAAATALAPATTALDKLAEDQTALQDIITGSPQSSPPSAMPNIFKWTWPTGHCQPLPFTFTITAGSEHADDGGAFCDTYNDVAHPLIYWFLNMLTAIYIFSIWSRSMTQIVGGR